MASASQSQHKYDRPIFLRGGKVGVLLIHGFTSTPYFFHEVSQQIHKAGYTVLVPLLAGHGTTPEDLEKTTWKDWCRSAEAGYDELAKECREILVIGGSFGANLACYVAARNQVIGVVLIGFPRWMKGQRRALILGNLALKLGKKYYTKPIGKREMYDGGDLLFGPTHSYIKVPLKSAKECMHFIGKICPRYLGRISDPTLIIQSTHDGFVYPSSARYAYKIIPSKNKHLVWINDAHHQLHNGNYRTLVYQLITDFMLAWVKRPAKAKVSEIDTINIQNGMESEGKV